MPRKTPPKTTPSVGDKALPTVIDAYAAATYALLLPLLIIFLPLLILRKRRQRAATSEVGVMGLGVMGPQLALNLAEKLGSPVSGFDLDGAKGAGTRRASIAAGLRVRAFTPLRPCRSLKRPRKVLLLVPAGKPTDAAIKALMRVLSKGDVIVDCGNEWYVNTQRRERQLRAAGLRYLGCGLGGARGARDGLCLMPGGAKAGWELVRPLLEAIAATAPAAALGGGRLTLAKEASAPRGRRWSRHRGRGRAGHRGGGGGAVPVRAVRPGGSGHYVKRVHNGIEYGMMQLLGEAAPFCRQVGGLGAPQLADLFDELNGGDLQSYLVEVTAALYRKDDDKPPLGVLEREVEGGSPERLDGRPSRPPLVDALLDVCGAKGTGKWTVQRSADLGVPCATIQAALDARALSALKGERKQAAALLNFDRRASFGPGSRKPLPAFEWRDELEAALYCSLLCSYTQGMAHLQAASREHGWRLDLADLAAIWCGGCIIRARVLHDIHAAYRRDPRLPSLLLDATIARELRGARRRGAASSRSPSSRASPSPRCRRRSPTTTATAPRCSSRRSASRRSATRSAPTASCASTATAPSPPTGARRRRRREGLVSCCSHSRSRISFSWPSVPLLPYTFRRRCRSPRSAATLPAASPSPAAPSPHSPSG